MTICLTAASACGGKQQVADGATAVWDSVTLTKSDTDSVIVKADYPTGGDMRMVYAYSEYVSEWLGGSYEGTYDNPKAMLEYYADTLFNHLRGLGSDYRMNGDNGLFDGVYINKVYDDALLTTYELTRYTYEGGAHGTSSLEGMTIRKADGRKLDASILKQTMNDGEMVDEWQSLLKKGLMKYFDVKSEKELAQMLFEDKSPYIPNPVTPPYFTREGLKLVYQRYEIAPYAAGTPTVIIPYDKAKRFLNITGARLIPSANKNK